MYQDLRPADPKNDWKPAANAIAAAIESYFGF